MITSRQVKTAKRIVAAENKSGSRQRFIPLQKSSLAQHGCRFCGAELGHVFVDLGQSPPCQNFLTAEQLNQNELFYPLVAYVCDRCFLVQLEEIIRPQEIFCEYAYFSSFADTWVEHARLYSEAMIARFDLRAKSQVVEIASNDGYLLQHFAAKGIPVLGIEPAHNVARVAMDKGIPTQVAFFGEALAEQLAVEGRHADLLIGNNVLAHVPDINGFVSGMKKVLKPQGVITMEFPHLMRLVDGNQFDTIYHEHFSYFSFTTVEKIFAAHGLRLFDVEELSTHGGSLRIFACHRGDNTKRGEATVKELKTAEAAAGMNDLNYYLRFGRKVEETKRKILEFFMQAKRENKSIAGYGAPGKGNTLLNYCGIGADMLNYCVDRNPYKHGKYLPGTHVPVFHPDKIRETRPDYVLILPWNLKNEIMQQISYIREWDGKFVTPIPEVTSY
jgi:SAM-dependent methyltransferase